MNKIKIHKPGCLANTACLVYHVDGICDGPYGKCTCDEIGHKPEPKCEHKEWNDTAIEGGEYCLNCKLIRAKGDNSVPLMTHDIPSDINLEHRKKINELIDRLNS